MKTKLIYLAIFVGGMSLNSLASELKKDEDESEFSAEPMSENDMGNVSLDAGLNILNVYGSTEAGLTTDAESGNKNASVKNGKDQTETQLADSADEEIKKLTRGEDRTGNNIVANTPSSKELQSAIDETNIKVGESEVFTTSSQIKYKSNNFKHQMTESGDGRVTISRDLHVELLKLENLSGDHHETDRSAGDIYLSDWRSRGDTTITPR